MLLKTQPEDHASCRLFAVLRKANGKKVTREQALQGILRAAKCGGGSEWGAGFAVFNAPEHDLGRYKAKVLIRDERALDEIKTGLTGRDIGIINEKLLDKIEPGYNLWEVLLTARKEILLRAVRELHWQMHTDNQLRARFISLGQYSETWKGIRLPY